MTQEFYNKISIPYQTLSDRFSSLNKMYHNNYAIYDIGIFNNARKEQFEFLKQFEKIPFKVFFSNDYLEKNDVGGNYFDSETIVITQDTINIHTEFSMVLFYYLINELKDDIAKFLSLLNNKDFEEKFRGFYKVDEYRLKYSLLQHEVFFKFMIANVPNFGLIYHLFHRTNSGYMYADEHRMIIRVKGIQDLLEANETVYNFQNYQIV